MVYNLALADMVKLIYFAKCMRCAMHSSHTNTCITYTYQFNSINLGPYKRLAPVRKTKEIIIQASVITILRSKLKNDVISVKF